jgi:hypothetical protein
MARTHDLERNGAAVRTFGTRIHNVLRVGELTTNLVTMYESQQWRAYAHNAGPVHWRAAEFDYFLIAEGVPYEDVSRVVAWYRAGATLAPGMASDDKRKRREFADAAKAWPSDTGESLEARAQRLGWLPARDSDAPASPISHYGRAVARDKLPLGTRATGYQLRGTVAALSAARRRELDALVVRLTAGLTPTERRYVRARISGTGRGRPRLNGPLSRQAAWYRRQQETSKN